MTSNLVYSMIPFSQGSYASMTTQRILLQVCFSNFEHSVLFSMKKRLNSLAIAL